MTITASMDGVSGSACVTVGPRLPFPARVEIDPLTFLELGEAMGAVRTSMLQDYERGRALELAAIGDAVRLSARSSSSSRST